MELYIYDNNLNGIGLIDTFESLIWRRKKRNIGTFELHVLLEKEDEEAQNIINLLQQNHYIMKDNDETELAIIKTIKLSDKNSEKIVVRGFLIDVVMSERINLGHNLKSGTVEEVFKHFVNKNFIDTTPNRVHPLLELHPSRGIVIAANEENSYGTISEWLSKKCAYYGVGWRVLFDLPRKKFLFDVFQGLDRSSSQTINPQVTFSMEYENVLSQTYMDDITDEKTTAIVGGAGEGNERYIEIVNDNATGLNRKEVFIDARDLQPEDENGNPIPEVIYREMLVKRGNEKLSEYKRITSFDSGISILSNYVYRVDYDLGDIVTIENRRWGITIDTHISEIAEIYEKNIVDENEVTSMEVEVVFGENVPTLIDKIRRVIT